MQVRMVRLTLVEMRTEASFDQLTSSQRLMPFPHVRFVQVCFG
jgi:hypothetical protein